MVAKTRDSLLLRVVRHQVVSVGMSAPKADISHSEKPRKHSIAKPNLVLGQSIWDRKLPISGQRKFTDFLLAFDRVHLCWGD
jgi:hypothetical protein